MSYLVQWIVLAFGNTVFRAIIKIIEDAVYYTQRRWDTAT